MPSTLARLAAILIAALGCSSSTAPVNCSVPKTAAAYRDEPTDSFIVTRLTRDGSSALIEAATHGGSIQFFVADTTPVFFRVSEGIPRPTFLCNLAVGELVEIPFSDGFGDFNNPPPPITVSQIVIDQ